MQASIALRLSLHFSHFVSTVAMWCELLFLRLPVSCSPSAMTSCARYWPRVSLAFFLVGIASDPGPIAQKERVEEKDC